MKKKSHAHSCYNCKGKYTCWGRICKEEHMQQRCDDCLEKL